MLIIAVSSCITYHDDYVLWVFFFQNMKQQSEMHAVFQQPYFCKHPEIWCAYFKENEEVIDLTARADVEFLFFTSHN